MKNLEIGNFINQLILSGAPGAIAVSGTNIVFGASLLYFAVIQSNENFNFKYNISELSENIFYLINQDSEIYNNIINQSHNYQDINSIPLKLQTVTKELQNYSISIKENIKQRYLSDYNSANHCFKCALDIINSTISGNNTNL